MNVPEDVAASTTLAPRGSKLAGFGLAWLVMIVCYGAELLIVAPLSHSPDFLSLFVPPWVVAILMAIAFMAAGRTRTAVGIAIGLVTVLVACVVLFLLLVSALSHNFR